MIIFFIYEALIRTLFVPDVKSAGPGLRHATHFHRRQSSLRIETRKKLN
jgi:hypothetical protein